MGFYPILQLAGAVLLLTGCAFPARDVRFAVEDYDRPVLLSNVDRIGTSEVEHTSEFDLFLESSDTCRAYTGDIVVIPAGYIILVASTEQMDPEAQPRRDLRADIGANPRADVFIESLRVEHWAFWAAFWFRESNRVEMKCNAFDTSGRDLTDAPQ
jgi:hypothetical protein